MVRYCTGTLKTVEKLRLVLISGRWQLKCGFQHSIAANFTPGHDLIRACGKFTGADSGTSMSGRRDSNVTAGSAEEEKGDQWEQ